MNNRSQARELTLQVLFQKEFAPSIDTQEFLKVFYENEFLTESAIEYAENLIKSIEDHKEAIDKIVESCATHWKIERIALVDLNIMRIATCEMKILTPPIDSGTAIDEAVEIAKKYGSTNSGSFVNGILDQIGRQEWPSKN